MLAPRQVLGSFARTRVSGGSACRARRLATATNSALDRKVCFFFREVVRVLLHSLFHYATL